MNFNIVEFFSQTLHFVQTQHHGSIAVILLIGIVFGAVIQWTRVDTFDKIAGFAMLHGFKVPKMLFFAIGLASIGLYFMIKMGWAHYHIKPIMLGGIVIGGILFAIGMAILGLCPGTGPVAVSEGNLDVLVGLIGGLLAGALFTYLYPDLKAIMGPNLGKPTLAQLVGHDWFIFVYGIFLIIIAFALPNKEVEEEVGEI